MIAGDSRTAAESATHANCASCHGGFGQVPQIAGIPYLSGQKPEYIVAQFMAFESKLSTDLADQALDGRMRIHPAMARFTNGVSEAEARELAITYSEQPCIRVGQAMPPLAVNRCAACHGEQGISASPEVPNLAGQNYRYMVNQIDKFREIRNLDQLPDKKKRVIRNHPAMDAEADTFTTLDMAALAYYAALPCR